MLGTVMLSYLGRPNAEVVDQLHPVGGCHNHNTTSDGMRPMPGEERSGEVAKNHRGICTTIVWND